MPKLKGYNESGWVFLRQEDGTVWITSAELTAPVPTDGQVRVHTVLSPEAWVQIVKALAP